MLRIGVILGAIMVVAAMVAPLSAAPSGVTWGTLKRGESSNKGYYRANMAQKTDWAFDGSNTYNYSIYFSDFDADGSGTYAAPYCKGTEAECPWQVAVFVERTSNGGATWTDKVMINDLNGDGDPEEDGERVTLCGDHGANVYAAWATQPNYYTSAVGSGPRALRFRSNDNYGASADWNPIQALTSLKAKVDYPAMACEAGKIFITFTNAKTGDIHLIVSSDGGATWAAPGRPKASAPDGAAPLPGTIIATTKAVNSGPYPYGPGGYGGKPMIGVSDDGMTIGVAYLVPERRLSTNPTKVKAVISNDGGTTWDAPVTIAKSMGKASGGYVGQLPVGADGATDRVGFAYVEKSQQVGHVVEYHESGGWQAPTTFAAAPPPGYSGLFSAGLGMDGSSKDAVAFGACYDSPCKNYKGAGISMMYTQSTDNGATWSDVQTVADGGLKNSYNFNNYAASVVFNTATTRYVMFQGLSTNWWNNQLSFRVGTGG